MVCTSSVTSRLIKYYQRAQGGAYAQQVELSSLWRKHACTLLVVVVRVHEKADVCVPSECMHLGDSWGAISIHNIGILALAINPTQLN